MASAIRILALPVLCCSLAVAVSSATWSSDGPPSLPEGRLVWVGVSLGGSNGDLTELRVSSADTARIEALASVIRSGVPAKDHKCRDTGSITFVLTNGSTVKLGLLGGHSEGSYEYRYYRDLTYAVFRVDRAELETVLRCVGVCGLDPGGPGGIDPTDVCGQ